MDTFIVAFHGGSWRIGYQDQWYGTYSDKRSAEKMAVGIARAYGELPTKVAVRANGREQIVWNPLTSRRRKSNRVSSDETQPQRLQKPSASS
jgi:hypothetical protein